jgi:hypothetical protein
VGRAHPTRLIEVIDRDQQEFAAVRQPDDQVLVAGLLEQRGDVR